MTAGDPLEMIDEIMSSDHTEQDLLKVRGLVEMAVESRLTGCLDALDDLAEISPEVFDDAFCARMEERAFELGVDDALARRIYASAAMGEAAQAELFTKVKEVADRYGGMALSLVAAMYMDGLGTPRDPAKAYEYATRSKEAGNSGADSIIAELKLSGEAGGKDVEGAVSMLLDLALSGDATAQYDLGRIYLDGVHAERDEGKGIDYLIQSAELGYAPAAMMLLDLRKSGTDVGCDPVAMLDSMARNGDVEAAANLAQLYIEDPEYCGDTAKAEVYIRMGAELGHVGCVEELVYRIADDTAKEEYEGELYDLIRYGVACGDEDLRELLEQIEEDRKKAGDVPTDDRIRDARPGMGRARRRTGVRGYLHRQLLQRHRSHRPLAA